MTDDFMTPEDRDLPLEPRLAEAARAYHPPPATPREAMWARIAAARAEAAGTPMAPVTPVAAPAVAPDTRVVSLDAARARRRPVRTWAILAGTLAAGIAMGVIGRDLGRSGTDAGASVATAPAQPDASATSVAAAGNDSATRLASDAAPAWSGSGPRPGTVKPLPGVVQPQRGTGSEGTQRVADAGGPPPNTNTAPRDRNRVTTGARPGAIPRSSPEYAGREPNRAGAAGATLYHAAAVQTLSQAEALLVAWRVDAPRDTVAARQLGTWARDVLGSTRLLLDSPAAADARLRTLLDDLELVLAQIVQLSGAPLTDEERALLERSVRARDLLPRIRSAVPAGPSGGATLI